MSNIWSDDEPIKFLSPWEELLLEVAAQPTAAFPEMAAYHALLKNFQESIRPWFLTCESPLEQVAFVAMLIVASQNGFQLELKPTKTISKSLFLQPLVSFRKESPLVELTLQQPFQKYRLDFLLKYKNAVLGVECDGGQHNQKYQISRDKKRDRRILSEGGISIMRFTGEEVFSNPLARISEAYQYLVNQTGYSWQSQ